MHFISINRLDVSLRYTSKVSRSLANKSKLSRKLLSPQSGVCYLFTHSNYIYLRLENVIILRTKLFNNRNIKNVHNLTESIIILSLEKQHNN